MAILHMLRSSKDTICESFVIEAGGKVLVIDGGFEFESGTLFETIEKLGRHVNAWFFTHPHIDHYGAFIGMMESHAKDIKVDSVYCNFLSEELLCEYEPVEKEHTKTCLPKIKELIKNNSISEITMHKGDVYTFNDAKITVLREPDDSIHENIINNSSTVFRLDAGGKSVLFLGDLGTEGGKQLLNTCSNDLIRCDYVQMAHHGQNGVEKAVYKAISPKCCLWCTPTWLWDNVGPDGYDSGNFKTVIVRGWMSELGVKKHYVNKDGPFAIAL
ncbi:MAG: MBL fold metallo-hydrolase [Clostridia bacterium]|nr:MBL fold metallo-hydrolase [Clostridia bacterium]